MKLSLALVLASTVASTASTSYTKEYDYIIVGGGTSGLVLAARLSATPSNSVLVIEAGHLFEETEPPSIDIQFPRYSGWNTGQKYHWNISWTPIAGLGANAVGNLPLAKVFGGGSAINGMFFDRGTPADYDLWEELGNPGWGWEGLLPWFKKSETFTPPADAAWAAEYGITWDMSVRGDSGPVHVSYPPWLYPQTKAYWAACRAMGLPFPRDGAGDARGCFMTPNAMDPATMTRSYAKTAYHNMARDRGNYHFLQEREVTRVLFEGRRAVGVEYAKGPGEPVVRVRARREVVMAAGAVHTPRLLQLSGVGERKLLERLGIEVVVDLPGVGAGLQDHVGYFMRNNVSLPKEDDPTRLTTDPAYDAEMKALFLANRTGPWAISQGNGAGFFPLPQISPSNYTTLLASAAAASASLPNSPALHPTVLSGHALQRSLLLQHFAHNATAVLEVIFAIRMSTTLVLTKPLSRGRVLLNSSSPWAHPLVHMHTFTAAPDVAILVEGLKFARRLWSQPALQAYAPVEAVPGAGVRSEEEIREALWAGAVPSLAHPSCSCPMLPREMGGCVDTTLRVYGVQGLRIVDASVMPVIPASHLMATVYAVAEKAADLIISGV
ncbi:hypothetical protein EDC01DRAFT_775381 [Geopyxis carbonaria]|nr:hypothetical protein EDC01DRAFT_775381 [Geopyxis carbonaria]